MIFAASLAALMGGTGLVAVAPRVPSRLATLEWSGGLLVILGLALMGAGLTWTTH